VARTATSPPARTSVAEVAEFSDRSDDLFAGTFVPDEPGCSAAVAIEGEVVWAGAGGAADLSTGRAIDTSTTFAIASVSKQFTATAVLLLAQDGQLSLDDPLSRWLPDLPAWADEVTLGQAMHHVSGIPDYVEQRVRSGVAWTDPRTVADTLSEIAGVEALGFPPGNRFQYSSSNYALMTEVVRAVTGTPLAELVRERVFEPLGLNMEYDASGWDPDTTDPSSARGYQRDPTTGEWGLAGTRWEPHGDAGIQTTPSELVRWADNYRTGQVGGDALLDDVMADATEVGRVRYGAGIVERDDGDLWHDGAAPGHLTDFRISEDRATAIAVACNGDRGSSSAIRYVATALHQIWDR
jgi:CubicO group peptidase (beta-lactamase class C family)